MRKSKDHLANPQEEKEREKPFAFQKKNNYASRKFVVELFAYKMKCIYFQNDRVSLPPSHSSALFGQPNEIMQPSDIQIYG